MPKFQRVRTRGETKCLRCGKPLRFYETLLHARAKHPAEYHAYLAPVKTIDGFNELGDEKRNP